MPARFDFRFHARFTCVLGLFLLTANVFAQEDGPMGVERVARVVWSHYESHHMDSDDATVWVQVDLGASKQIEQVKILPMIDGFPHSTAFPTRFRLETSDDPEFKSAARIADCTKEDYSDPGDKVVTFKAGGVSGRYVRLTATHLRQKYLALTKLEVWCQGKNVATGCPVTDSSEGVRPESPLTSPDRPQGERVVTDNPQNVISSILWHSVPYEAQAPKKGVFLEDGLFKTVMKNNVEYLLNSFTDDELLRGFRERAGKENPEGMRKPDDFWDGCLPGSSAGRFLMGAGTTLRWLENPELRRRMEAIVDEIQACQSEDGYLMAYPSNSIFFNERAAYTRSWVTHGLIEAGYGGCPKAFEMLRAYYDWFDQCPYRPELLRRGGQGVQGMIANTRMYFTPVGKPEDLQVVQRYFQENYWLDQLAARDPKAIWQYPYDHPHCYLLTSIEPYLDLYRATGRKHYLKAALGGWDLYHEKWEHTGGSIAICEWDTFPPYSYYLRKNTGELCGNVFWIFLNQRFQLLYPNEEKYASEIEKSIYNVALPNQGGTKGIRYFAKLNGHKDEITAKNTCCEGQGTRIYGSLPEFIYSTTRDGIYVNQYTASSFSWVQDGQPIGIEVATGFPFTPQVRLHLMVNEPIKCHVHIRIPSWASKDMHILVNDKKVAVGKPGTFVDLYRKWASTDHVDFTLPMGMKLTQYEGMEKIEGLDRYALEYGPILMALTGPTSGKEPPQLNVRPEDLIKELKAREGEPLHFSIKSAPGYQYIPYWEVQEEAFACFPIMGHEHKDETPEPGDLALASAGAKATSDSEYKNEPGCTSKAIDGIIAKPDDFSNRWHSALDKAHPHWIEVKLPEPALIGSVVVRFADLDGYPVSFRGVAQVKGKKIVVFDVKDQKPARSFKTTIKPVMTDTFRLEIRASANPAYPNAAQISEIELYAPKD